MPTHNHGNNGRKRHAWLVDVNMGYGHSRPAHTLRDLSCGEVISANDYPGIPKRDKDLWRRSRELYETLSRMKPVPLIGDAIFEVLDRWQEIPKFYPRRDLSDPNMQLRSMYSMIRKGLGKHLVEKLSADPVPFIATFFLPAFAAEYFNYPGDIYCITTDTDISRTWAPMDAKKSRIKYLVGNGRTVERLKLYGVREENIILTGFPLPKELIGGPKPHRLQNLLIDRLDILDPQGIFHTIYKHTLKAELGENITRRRKVTRPLTLTYVVGGAGAQKRLGIDIMESLKGDIMRHRIRMNLIAGTRRGVVDYFENAALELGLKKSLGTWLNIPYFRTRPEYFDGFNTVLETTDILWTKPSELSFYTGLGLAIIMAPPIGSQEEFNRVWLRYVGGGIEMNDPKYTNEWLFDWINSGGLARMAWNGFVYAPTHGTYRIEDVILGRKSEIRPLPLIV